MEKTVRGKDSLIEEKESKVEELLETILSDEYFLTFPYNCCGSMVTVRNFSGPWNIERKIDIGIRKRISEWFYYIGGDKPKHTEVVADFSGPVSDEASYLPLELRVYKKDFFELAEEISEEYNVLSGKETKIVDMHL
ncbi:MAG: hypothetical protein ABIH25_01560 [Candidatus Woesearchaeota archaeon]